MAETSMKAPISASLGAMGSLLQKLKVVESPSSDIHQLIVQLSVIQDRLEQLSKVRDPSLTVIYWMKDVRELTYDMKDFIDDCEVVNADTGAKTEWEETISGFLPRVNEAKERWTIYNLDPGSSPINMVVSHHLPTVFRKSVDAVGMDGPRNKLLGWMAEDEDENLKVLCILGAEGIGKTKLAELLWRELQGKFECRAFVQTAKKPDIRMILRNILSQVRPLQPVVPCAVTNLIDDVKNHLKNRRYFIVIDDLWAPSVWDVVRHAFPVNNCGSRIITTTKVDEVALACCVYNPQYIYKMKALSADDSKKLLISRTFGSGEHPGHFHKVTHEIARKCGGSPLAIIIMGSLLAMKQATVQNLEDKLKHWQYVQNFLCNNLRVNPTSDEILKQVLNLCYNSLPCCLKTCLLYLSVYPDNHILLKKDLVNQWVAQDFICSSTQENAMEVAMSYFNKLVNLGLIQCTDIKYKSDVLTYAVHHIVHDFITRKAQEENFVTAIDYSQTTVRLTYKVHRLSLHLGSATYATTPANIGLSQIRSFIFIGLFNCMPSIKEFKLLRVATLHFSCDDGDMIDLTEIYQLILLRYLQVNCNVTVKLPDQMQCLEHLETLEINASDAVVPSSILHLSFLQLQLQGMPNQPGITDDIKNLSKDPSTSHTTTSLHDSTSASSPPVQTLELLPSECIFSGIPEWIAHFRELRILKIVVREFLDSDMDILTELGTLAALSLYVQEPTARGIVFRKRAFSALVFFEFRCHKLRIEFQEGAMPNLQRLYLVFDAHRGEEYGIALLGMEHLLNLTDISARIGIATGAIESDRGAAESVCKNAIGKHPCGPTFRVLGMVSQVQEANHLDRRQIQNHEEDGSPSKPHLIAVKSQLEETKNDLSDSRIQPLFRFQLTQPDFFQSGNDSGSSREQVTSGLGPSAAMIRQRGTATKVLRNRDIWAYESNSKEESTQRKTDNKSQYPSTLPKNPTLDSLRVITDNFSSKREIGRGAFGVVYKGVLDNGEVIAVKKVERIYGIHARRFQNEANNLLELEHKNVVKLIGSCCQAERQVVEHDGKYVFTDVVEKLLCYEYLPNGSLDNYIYDESNGIDWPTRFKIILGICNGLHFLHKEWNEAIIHMNLKLSNILLGDNMVPKIADFGLSRLFGQEQTRVITQNVVGWIGYIAPEYYNRGEISEKSDIFSLGILILEIVTGLKNDSSSQEVPSRILIDNARRNWLKTSQIASKYPSLAADRLLQAKRCIEIALNCVETDPKKRPSVGEIIDKLEYEGTDISGEPNIHEKISPIPQFVSTLPRNPELQFLEVITNNFSNDREIGALHIHLFKRGYNNEIVSGRHGENILSEKTVKSTLGCNII